MFQSGLFQSQTDFFGDNSAAGQNRDVLQHGFAAVAKTGSFHRNGFQNTANAVHHQSCQCFAFNIFGNNQQGAAGFGHLFQHRQQVADVADFFIKQQHKRIVQACDLFFQIVHKVRRQVATVKLHPFNHFQLVFQRFAVFHGDHAFFAHFLHRIGDDFAHLLIRVSRNRAHLRDLLVGFARFGDVCQLAHQRRNRFVNAAFQIGGVHASGNVFHAFGNNGLSQNGCGGGAIACHIVGFGRNFFHHLRAHVFKFVFQFNFFGYGNTVFGDVWAAE